MCQVENSPYHVEMCLSGGRHRPRRRSTHARQSGKVPAARARATFNKVQLYVQSAEVRTRRYW